MTFAAIVGSDQLLRSVNRPANIGMMNHRMEEQPLGPDRLQVLLIEDDPADAEYLREILLDQKDQRVRAVWVKDIEAAQPLTLQEEFDLILLDLFLAGSSGLDTFLRAQSVFPDIPIVVLTGLDDRGLALQMVRAGAQDYVLKTALDGRALTKTLFYAVERSRLKKQLESSRRSFLNLLSDNSDGILVVDKDRYVVYSNPAAASLFKQPVEQLVGTPFGLPLVSSGPAEVDLVREDGELTVVEMRTSQTDWEGETTVLVVLRDITDRKRAEKEREILIGQLQEALAQVKQLSGLLPICSNCKKIRDDQGYWKAVDQYIGDHSDAQISHSICPECLKKLYPDLYPDEQ